MDQEDIRQYLPHFIYALTKSGATRWTVDSFRAYWNTLPTGTHKLPCPLCYANGHEGQLQTGSSEARPTVHCDRCSQEFPLNRH